MPVPRPSLTLACSCLARGGSTGKDFKTVAGYTSEQTSVRSISLCTVFHAKAGRPPLSGLRTAVASIPPPTGLTGQDISRICFLICARSGNNGFWNSMSPQGFPNTWLSIVRHPFSQKTKQLGYSNLSSAFPINTRLLRTGIFLCHRDSHILPVRLVAAQPLDGRQGHLAFSSIDARCANRL